MLTVCCLVHGGAVSCCLALRVVCMLCVECCKLILVVGCNGSFGVCFWLVDMCCLLVRVNRRSLFVD